MKERLENWWVVADSHEKANAIMAASFVVLVIYTVLIGTVRELRA
jgi:hypothetical protein